MIKKINLDASTLVHYDENNTVVVPSRELQIETKSKYNLNRAFYAFKNADVTETVPYSRVLTVPEKLVFAGRLYLVVLLYDENGSLIKKWQVHPLNIVEVDGGFGLSDWCESIEHRLDELDERTKIIL